MTQTEIDVFIAEIRKDIIYIKERLDDRCKTYDKHLESAPNLTERLIKVENKSDTMWLSINTLWGVLIVGGLVTLVLKTIGIIK